MKQKLQLAFLLIFIALLALGKIQLWLGIFVVSLLLTPFLGRLYCSYICPINTLSNWSQRFAKKKKLKFTTWLKHPAIRYALLALLVITMVTMVLTTRAGKKLPILPLLTALAVLLSLVFEEALWHRYLCPYGTLLAIFASKTPKGYHIKSQTCLNCGKCQTVCPADAIIKGHAERDVLLFIDNSECLLCGSCADVCPADAIYRS